MIIHTSLKGDKFASLCNSGFAVDKDYMSQVKKPINGFVQNDLMSYRKQTQGMKDPDTSHSDKHFINA